MDQIMSLTPLYAGGAVAGLDRFVLGHTNPTQNLAFGGSLAIGKVVSNLSRPMIATILPSSSLASASSLNSRILEVAVSAGIAYVVNRYVLKNQFTENPMEIAKLLGVLVAGDVIGEYADDFLNKRALNFIE